MISFLAINSSLIFIRNRESENVAQPGGQEGRSAEKRGSAPLTFTLGVWRKVMAKDAIYEGTREVRTFVDLAHGADVMIMKTEQDLKGSYYTTMSALLMSAFTFEAYLNHLGEKSIKFWEEIEPIKISDKYSVLCKQFNISPDFSKRPYQTLKSLIKFRNSIAHGKSQILQERKEVSSKDEPYEHIPKAHWEEYCNLENAKKAKDDISLIITELHIAAGLGDYPFIHGAGIGSLTIKPSNPAFKRDSPKSGRAP